MIIKHLTACMRLIALSCALIACTSSPKTETPPAPEMPAHWKVVFDVEIAPEQIKTIEDKLGASISALRNTAYDVKERRVQINLIVAPDAANADRLMEKLESMKSKQALLQKGLIIYEFVGTNDALPYIQQGREHIASIR